MHMAGHETDNKTDNSHLLHPPLTFSYPNLLHCELPEGLSSPVPAGHCFKITDAEIRPPAATQLHQVETALLLATLLYSLMTFTPQLYNKRAELERKSLIKVIIPFNKSIAFLF